FTETLNQASLYFNRLIKSDSNVLQEISDLIKMKKLDLNDNDQIDKLIPTLEKKYGSSNITKKYSLIISYMDNYKFNKDKFVKFMDLNIMNLDNLDIIDFQHRYIKQLIPKNSTYGNKKKLLEHQINLYKKNYNEYE